jgi:hypothetical protein
VLFHVALGSLWHLWQSEFHSNHRPADIADGKKREMDCPAGVKKSSSSITVQDVHHWL